MKYSIRPVTGEFQPFTITLTFETKEEYIHFHDNVMLKLTRVPSHQFHGDVYWAGRGKIVNVDGRI